MLGKSYIVGPKLNNLEWKLGGMNGLEFEQHIFNVLCKIMKPYYKLDARIRQTPRTKDNGKDIIITSPVPLSNILGIDFFPADKGILRIYIECKSSEHDKIRYNNFSGNLSRIKNDDVTHYVLVTNTTIVPYSYYHFKK